MYHHDPNVFPDPEVFRPERWLVSDGEFNELKKYMMPFSRGSRMCVAMKYVISQISLFTKRTDVPLKTHFTFLIACTILVFPFLFFSFLSFSFFFFS